MIEVVLILIGLLWILFASVQDLKSREVSNWLNFSLIIFVLGLRFFYSLFESGNFFVFYQGLVGLGIFFILGNLFYYGRLFGGGDAKLMIALGTVLPLGFTLKDNLNIFVWFLFLFLIVGAVYGAIWSVVLTVANFGRFRLKFLELLRKNRSKVFISIVIGIVIICFGLYEPLLFVLGFMVLFLPYLYIYSKAVDDSCMIKRVLVGDLVEGDLLYRGVRVGKERIEVNWEGLSSQEIKKIRKFKKFVLLRQGIPFVPVFLIGFILLAYFYFSGFLFNLWF